MSFKTYIEAFKAETDFRKNIDVDKLCTYGIKALDDAMIAIAPNELVVIGAASGYGKTELSLSISRHNALRGKRVAHYHLEGGYVEAIQRMKYRDICDLYYENYAGKQIDLDYRKWTMNKDQDPLLLKLENQVYTNLRDKLENKLYFYDRPEGLTCEAFASSLLDFHSLVTAFENPFKRGGGYDLDLVVIDHLQYFSLEKDENEIQEITHILKEAKRITDNFHIPVILVSHFRKLPRGHGLPDKEDLYGTSNIHKVANTCIIIHPDHESDKSSKGLYPTYLRIAKSRIGIRPSDVIYVDFNIHKRAYEDDYEMKKAFSNGTVESERMKDAQKPHWAMRTDKEEENENGKR